MTLEQLPLIMLRALCFTIMIECAAGWIMGVRDRQGQSIIVLVNLLTNPLVVSLGAAILFFAGHEYLAPATIAMEMIVVIAEGMIYKSHLTVKMDPFTLSLVCNLSSYLIGVIINGNF